MGSESQEMRSSQGWGAGQESSRSKKPSEERVSGRRKQHVGPGATDKSDKMRTEAWPSGVAA